MTDTGDALPPGTEIEEFVLEQELGTGGFGITYLAFDVRLKRKVAIKEYLPSDWATRRVDGSVGPRSTTVATEYEWGLARFLERSAGSGAVEPPADRARASHYYLARNRIPDNGVRRRPKPGR